MLGLSAATQAPVGAASLLASQPLANLFPLLHGDDLAALAADIAASDIRRRVTLREGEVRPAATASAPSTPDIGAAQPAKS